MSTWNAVPPVSTTTGAGEPSASAGWWWDGARAGLIGALAFLLAMGLDLLLLRRRTNDLRLLAGLVPGGRRHWPWLGTLLHCANGAALGILYGRLVHRIPGPGWLRGLVFALAENAILWPVIVLLDRIHPEIRAGRLEPFNRPVPFLQEVWRHVAYGLALGWTYDRLTGRTHPAPSDQPHRPLGTGTDVHA